MRDPEKVCAAKSFLKDIMYIFSRSSQDKLNTCHADLIRLFNEVIKYRDCKIICGRRGKQEQDEAYADGKSQVKYPKSYHNRFPSHAVDAVPYPIEWENIDRFIEFGGFVLGIAAMMNIDIVWGGNFKKFFDGPHFQKKS